jgi:hypothetical protein
MARAPGSRLGRFLVEAPLGAGGSGMAPDYRVVPRLTHVRIVIGTGE